MAQSKPTIPRICEQCGGEFRTWQRDINRGWGRFCGRVCARRGAPRRAFADQFWARVARTDGCWLWPGSKYPNGYGSVYSRYPRSATYYAHRVAFELSYGAIPDGLHVCHRCDNPACVRPDLLFLGTPLENMADMRAKGRSRKGDRPNAARGSRSGQAKLTEAQVRVIRARYAAGGVTQTELAREFGVVATGIQKIVRRTSWRHI